jgi:predicted TPR repeat methyltransferase
VNTLAILLLALVQSAGSTPQPPAPPPADTPAAADPARILFPAGASGLVLVLVKADRTADYEAVISALKTAVAAAPEADRRIAQGWQVLKAREADAKGNAVYVHWLPAPVAEADYRPSILLDRLSTSLPETLLVKYRDALAAPPTRLTLDVFAALGVTALVPPPR